MVPYSDMNSCCNFACLLEITLWNNYSACLFIYISCVDTRTLLAHVRHVQILRCKGISRHQHIEWCVDDDFHGSPEELLFSSLNLFNLGPLTNFLHCLLRHCIKTCYFLHKVNWSQTVQFIMRKVILSAIVVVVFEFISINTGKTI